MLCVLQRRGLRVTAPWSACYSPVVCVLQPRGPRVTAPWSAWYSPVVRVIQPRGLRVTAPWSACYSPVVCVLQPRGLRVTAPWSACYSPVVCVLQPRGLRVTAPWSVCYSPVVCVLQPCPATGASRGVGAATAGAEQPPAAHRGGHRVRRRAAVDGRQDGHWARLGPARLTARRRADCRATYPPVPSRRAAAVADTIVGRNVRSVTRSEGGRLLVDEPLSGCCSNFCWFPLIPRSSHDLHPSGSTPCIRTAEFIVSFILCSSCWNISSYLTGMHFSYSQRCYK